MSLCFIPKLVIALINAFALFLNFRYQLYKIELSKEINKKGYILQIYFKIKYNKRSYNKTLKKKKAYPVECELPCEFSQFLLRKSSKRFELVMSSHENSY